MLSEHMGVRLEIWALAADKFGIWLLSGPDAWRSPRIPADSQPHFELETTLLEHGMPAPALVHSTSWRHDDPHVILTYVATFPVDDLVRDVWPDALPVSPKLLPAVGNPPPHGAAEPPTVRYLDVLHHGVRHLAYLRGTDASARDALSGHWVTHLERLEPALAGMYGDVR